MQSEGRTLRREIKSHMGLRGLAALLVVAYHLQFGGGYKLPIETATSFFNRCYLMVDLFFVLSGFILCYVTNADRGLSLPQVRTFFRDRFARIYPLHVFALGVLTVFTVGTSAILAMTGRRHQDFGPFSDWLSQLFLLNAWRPAEHEWNVPSWSISAEAFAYLLFPLLVSACVARPRLAQAAIFAGSLAFYVLVGRSLDITVGLAPLRCLAGFGLGMLLFFHRRWAEQVPARSWFQIVAIAWILAALAIPVWDALIMPGFVALVFLTWTDEGVASRWLSTAPLQWLGRISYSVYLMHVPVNDALWFVWARVDARLHLDPVVSHVVFLFVMFAAVLSVASFTFAYVEKPWRQRLRRQAPASAVTAVAAP
jgi:peptidoglycan/LPS O-acetylase OafA/YrhL